MAINANASNALTPPPSSPPYDELAPELLCRIASFLPLNESRALAQTGHSFNAAVVKQANLSTPKALNRFVDHIMTQLDAEVYAQVISLLESKKCTDKDLKLSGTGAIKQAISQFQDELIEIFLLISPEHLHAIEEHVRCPDEMTYIFRLTAFQRRLRAEVPYELEKTRIQAGVAKDMAAENFFDRAIALADRLPDCRLKLQTLEFIADKLRAQGFQVRSDDLLRFRAILQLTSAFCNPKAAYTSGPAAEFIQNLSTQEANWLYETLTKLECDSGEDFSVMGFLGHTVANGIGELFTQSLFGVSLNSQSYANRKKEESLKNAPRRLELLKALLTLRQSPVMRYFDQQTAATGPVDKVSDADQLALIQMSRESVYKKLVKCVTPFVSAKLLHKLESYPRYIRPEDLVSFNPAFDGLGIAPPVIRDGEKIICTDGTFDQIIAQSVLKDEEKAFWNSLNSSEIMTITKYAPIKDLTIEQLRLISSLIKYDTFTPHAFKLVKAYSLWRMTSEQANRLKDFCLAEGIDFLINNPHTEPYFASIQTDKTQFDQFEALIKLFQATPKNHFSGYLEPLHAEQLEAFSHLASHYPELFERVISHFAYHSHLARPDLQQLQTLAKNQGLKIKFEPIRKEAKKRFVLNLQKNEEINKVANQYFAGGFLAGMILSHLTGPTLRESHLATVVAAVSVFCIDQFRHYRFDTGADPKLLSQRAFIVGASTGFLASQICSKTVALAVMLGCLIYA